MMGDELTDLYERFRGLVRWPEGSPWLRAPAARSEIEFVEHELGYALPDDLKAMLRIHNGGRLLDAEEWLPCVANRDAGLLAYKQILDGVLAELESAQLLAGVVPGPRTLQVTAASQVGVLYDLDEQPGRLLYLEVTSDPPVVPLARSLTVLLDAYVAMAEAGFVRVDAGLGPRVEGPPDQVRQIFAEHKVADVASSGISAWLQWPGAADFSID